MLLRKVAIRKSKRLPHKWGPEEKSNPDYEWLRFVEDIEAVLGRKADKKERLRVGPYLRLNTKCFKDRPEPLRCHERKKFRELVREVMEGEGRVPGAWELKRIYKSVKGKKKRELWK